MKIYINHSIHYFICWVLLLQCSQKNEVGSNMTFFSIIKLKILNDKISWLEDNRVGLRLYKYQRQFKQSTPSFLIRNPIQSIFLDTDYHDCCENLIFNTKLSCTVFKFELFYIKLFKKCLITFTHIIFTTTYKTQALIKMLTLHWWQRIGIPCFFFFSFLPYIR